MSSKRSKFGKYLRKRREADGLTLRELAKKAKLQYGCIWRIETGMTSPDLETLEGLAQAFGETWVLFPEVNA